MPHRIRKHRPVAPTSRTLKPGYFYPGEVVRLLRLGDIDYAQLRRLLRIIRGDQGIEKKKWARYDLRDLGSLKVAIDLCGGPEALREGRHLSVSRVSRACEALRAAGVRDPLIESGLRLVGTRILATSQGLTFDAATGQLELNLVLTDATRYLQELRDVARAEVAVALRSEFRLLNPTRQARRVGTWDVGLAVQATA
jgi:hypothetical protein